MARRYGTCTEDDLVLLLAPYRPCRFQKLFAAMGGIHVEVPELTPSAMIDPYSQPRPARHMWGKHHNCIAVRCDS